MEFSKRLYELRKKNGLSQEELADKIQVTRQTVSKWENGDSAPEMEKLMLLSDYFHISLDELVLGRVPEISGNADVNKTTAKMWEEKVFTEENKRKAKKGLKAAGIVLTVFLMIDIISMIIYFIFYGFPTGA